MIINDKHKFIFIHVPKTAGTSMAAALSQLPGNNKTWISKRTKHETYSELLARLTREVGPAALARYTAIAFVRHTWDRISSLYRYLRDDPNRPEISQVRNFADFLHRAAAGERWITGLHSMRQQLEFFSHPAAADRVFVGHVEHLEEDFSTITSRLGFRAKLPHKNASSNRVHDYRSNYTDDLVEIVAALFTKEIAAFGYQFDCKLPTKRCSQMLQTWSKCA